MAEQIVLRSVDEAQDQMLGQIRVLEPETVPLMEALGRTLAEDVRADGDVPPFPNAAMDGYAVLGADVAAASADSPATLRIIADQAAGAMTAEHVRPGTAIRIMTGAPLPPGADTVVPFEDTDEQRPDALLSQGQVRIFIANRTGANVRAAGEDMRRGEVVVRAGTLVRPPEIGVLATVGAARPLVYRRPKVAILATGDELVEVDQTPGPGQIRNSNGYANVAQVLAAGGVPLQLPIARDTEAELRAALRAGLDWGADLFLTSGGVSVGDYDVVKKVLMEMGRMEFWRVRMKPGKPIAFGQIEGVPLLGLPGNPVSAMVGFELFARPALLKLQGRARWGRPTIRAHFDGTMTDRSDRRQYVRVIVAQDGPAYRASLTGEQGSGILTSMSRANGLMVIPEGEVLIAPGTPVDVLMTDWAEWA